MDVLTAARTLATDAACLEAIRAWRGRGIEAVLLKGSTLAEWLYPDAARPYTDGDLLVAPDRVTDASDVLRELGYQPAEGRFSDHAHPWLRDRDGAIIDLHVTIWGPSRPPEFVWRELQGWVAEHRLGGAPVKALNLPARALHVALHAAQHREQPRKPDDLRRAIAQASPAQWRDAERLADRLWALLPMAQGLALEPSGRELLERLPLARAALQGEESGAPLAVGFARLSEAHGARQKAAVLARALKHDPGGALRRLAQIPRTARALRRPSPGSDPRR